ncbi:hypothetical protein, unlikely [Trypanosoma brucei gambiense DAL972]|uniref:Uncharacterized protein n=1 Tax=Trypanosoma brucei gambiense (strain MHOM/CI/86/DAL972) TaxID=679716 RepID=C9ZP61_TRYB9|nr:hypothetical protein, unlikely [Trypanosoma brucei gambiense DAL972]CBH11189.1 hypothetical protein, unlikely [Trypanosoma brucei gambiense DAL972]|eukprot:XP_011773476.1 hypothetical protein, unlikely [Trypanosoma brucei gambiense DAL972]
MFVFVALGAPPPDYFFIELMHLRGFVCCRCRMVGESYNHNSLISSAPHPHVKKNIYTVFFFFERRGTFGMKSSINVGQPVLKTLRTPSAVHTQFKRCQRLWKFYKGVVMWRRAV